jgi:outer membrane protein assembly factor BamD (BamD/ComL family)
MKHLLSAMILLVIACTSPRDQQQQTTDELLKKANTAGQIRPDSASVSAAQTAIETFVRQFPGDSLSPLYLFELALLKEKRQQYPEAIEVLEQLYTSYPQSREASKAVFLQGFLYANVLNELDKAKAKYELYLEKYAGVDSKMTNDAKMELEHLGKSPEEILKKLQENSAPDTTQARV